MTVTTHDVRQACANAVEARIARHEQRPALAQHITPAPPTLPTPYTNGQCTASKMKKGKPTGRCQCNAIHPRTDLPHHDRCGSHQNRNRYPDHAALPDT